MNEKRKRGRFTPRKFGRQSQYCLVEIAGELSGRLLVLWRGQLNHLDSTSLAANQADAEPA